MIHAYLASCRIHMRIFAAVYESKEMFSVLFIIDAHINSINCTVNVTYPTFLWTHVIYSNALFVYYMIQLPSII